MLCLTCNRVRPAESRTDYTTERAQLIVDRGLCLCPALGRHRSAQRSVTTEERAAKATQGGP